MLDIISIGALNIDLIARVNRFPVADEEVAVQDLEIFHGGSAANVAVGVSRLGHCSGFVGMVGSDQFGEMLIEGLKKEGVDVSHLIKTEGNSGLVFAAINPAGERILYSSEGVSSRFYRSLIPVDYIKEARFLHLTSIIGEKAIDTLEFASSIAYDNNIKVILDPGSILAEKGCKALSGILGNCYLITPSQIEANMLTGLKGEKAGRRLLEYGPKAVIITRGAEGCLLITKDLTRNVSALRSKAVDTTGAGDSFAAGLISGLLENKGLEKATEFATLVASISVTRRGARTTPRREEIRNQP
ncbi:MAG: carbohydrate kinase family protein [Desulfobacterales bacterium]|nr:carbohydrate kinase family protein [Desulfobacterales bacterium]